MIDYAVIGIVLMLGIGIGFLIGYQKADVEYGRRAAIVCCEKGTGAIGGDP